MSTSLSHSVDDGPLRRVRSTGDMPRRPERLFMLSDNPSPAHPRRISEGGVHIQIQSSSPSVVVASQLQSQNRRQDQGRSQNYPQTQDQNQSPLNQPQGILRVIAYFGLGRGATQVRKAMVVLLWNFSWSFVQIVVITTMVALSGTIFKSPLDSSVSEWTACDRPLGAWACLWIARVIIATILSYWEYVRERAAIATFLQGGPSMIRRGNRITTTSPGNPTELQPIQQQGVVVTPSNPSYTRLSVLASLLTLSWFLTAHILEYTSINSCRHTSPHLWWLVFGILCIMYLMVFEVVVIGFVVLVITPIIFVFWNILLICLGRHPIQNPHIIKPDIDKLPKSVVEKIPLVMYIPPPPEGSDLRPTSSKIIASPHSYPPKAAQKPTGPPKPRFKFIRKISSFRNKGENGKGSPKDKLPIDVEKNPRSGDSLTWSDYWEESEYPFVVLEGNRAACAICLMDFEEPKKRPGLEHSLLKENKRGEEEAPVKDTEIEKDEEKVERDGIPATESSSSGITLEERTVADRLRLEDAGEIAQPLRLLSCGHVFHKTCLDPWLIDVSGRCPVCQRPVEIPEKKKRRSRDRLQNVGQQ